MEVLDSFRAMLPKADSSEFKEPPGFIGTNINFSIDWPEPAVSRPRQISDRRYRHPSHLNVISELLSELFSGFDYRLTKNFFSQDTSITSVDKTQLWY